MWSGVAKSLGLRRVDYQSMWCRVFIQALEDTTKNWQCLSDCCPMVHNGSQQNKQTTAYVCQSCIFFGMPERMAWTTAGSNRKVCHYNLVSFSLFSKPPYRTHGWNMGEIPHKFLLPKVPWDDAGTCISAMSGRRACWQHSGKLPWCDWRHHRPGHVSHLKIPTPIIWNTNLVAIVGMKIKGF